VPVSAAILNAKHHTNSPDVPASAGASGLFFSFRFVRFLAAKLQKTSFFLKKLDGA